MPKTRIVQDPTTGAEQFALDTEATEPRLRKVPGTTDDAGLAIIRRAVVLRLATLGELEPESQESTGRAIVAICRTYLTNESARLSEKGQS